MIERIASCRCGRLRATCTGKPLRVSVCHCLDCQRRSGSAFAAQARWPAAQVLLEGEHRSWSHMGDDGAIRAHFRFCPACGGTIIFENVGLPGTVAIPVGAFADPAFPAPRVSVFENRRHPWVRVTGVEEHFD